MSNPASKPYALLEALSVFGMIQLYIWKLRFGRPYLWILILMLVVSSHALRRETPAKLGFSRKNLSRSLTALAPFVVLLSLALLALGLVSRSIRHITPESGFWSLLLYCVWGLFQQYLLNGYFVNRFLEVAPARAPLLAAAFFSAAHLPNWFLMIVTLIGGYLSARVYLYSRNLYFLGLAHGVIGFLIYLVVPDTISHHLYVGPKWFS